MSHSKSAFQFELKDNGVGANPLMTSHCQLKTATEAASIDGRNTWDIQLF